MIVILLIIPSKVRGSDPIFPNFVFGDEDLVIVIGQDGLVANTLKYVPGRPIVDVNPDPNRYDGILLPFRAKDIKSVLSDVLGQKRHAKEITMAKASGHGIDAGSGQCTVGNGNRHWRW